MKIRQAREGDESFIVAAVRELANSLGEQSPLAEQYVREFLSQPGCGVLLAEVEGQIVGLVSYTMRPNLYCAGASGQIEELFVHEAFRGRGVARALMTEALRRLAQMGCAEVAVSTTPGNTVAQQLYRSLGFTDEWVLLEKHLR